MTVWLNVARKMLPGCKKGRKAVKTIKKCVTFKFNSLPNNKILARSKLKAFADDKLDVIKIIISLVDRLENTMGNGEKMLVTSIPFTVKS